LFSVLAEAVSWRSERGEGGTATHPRRIEIPPPVPVTQPSL
jgi:hypothetical protein